MAKKLCNVTKTKKVINKDCHNFIVYPQNKFYAIPYWSWDKFFKKKYLTEVMKETKNSYVIHAWNYMSTDFNLTVNSEVAYIKFAEQFCPKVLNQCDMYF